MHNTYSTCLDFIMVLINQPLNRDCNKANTW
uniref:Uncharacterized protein n=1 Tax=Rhizophora mucronata TaxID=61149 RepID=A0A2P2PZ27_RHIMU